MIPTPPQPRRPFFPQIQIPRGPYDPDRRTGGNVARPGELPPLPPPPPPPRLLLDPFMTPERIANNRLRAAQEKARIDAINREAEDLEMGRTSGERCECCDQPLPRQSQINPVGRAYPNFGPAST